MKKILYICKLPLVQNSSLKRKYLGQLEGFRQLALDAYHLAFDDTYYYLMHGEEMTVLRRIHFSKSKWYLHSLAFIDLYLSAKKALDLVEFDYLYVRNDPIEYIGLSMYRKAQQKGIFVITEIPSYPNVFANIRNPLHQLLMTCVEALCEKVNRYTDLFAIIGDPCEEYLGKPALNIQNAVNVAQFALRKPEFSNSIRLLGVASMSAWHGFDRLLQGLANYKGEQEVQLTLVGNEGDGSLQDWKLLAQKLGLGKKVIFLDGLYGEDLNELFAQSDVAISSIAWFRSKIQSGSPLKNREYMARGIPFVYSVADEGLSPDLDFALYIEDSESPVDVQAICEFALACRADASIPIRMRAFASQNMTWEAQYAKFFAYIKERFQK